MTSAITASPLQPVMSSDESVPEGSTSDYTMTHTHVLTKGVTRENHYGET